MAAMIARRLSIAWAALLLYAGSTSAATTGLRKVWEVDLRKLATPRRGLAGFPVLALRFSPDGKKLAVIADIYESGQARASRLLVIHTESPSVNAHEFGIPFGVLEDERGRGPALNFGWAPSGQMIYALGRVISLQSGKSCELPNQSVLISDNIAVLAQPYPPPVYSSTRLVSFDQRCEKQGEWDVEGGWLIMDVSADRHLLSIASRQGPESGLTELIVDPLDRRIIRSWPWKDTWGSAWEFADSGKTACVAGNPAQGEPSPAICRNVDTGLEIAKTTRNGDEPIAVASSATRLIASDYRSKHIAFGLEYETTLKGRFVWDFSSGKELASWYPPFETYPNIFSPEKQVIEPFRFAISPDGQYVAEGGDGTIRLFRIGP